MPPWAATASGFLPYEIFKLLNKREEAALIFHFLSSKPEIINFPQIEGKSQLNESQPQMLLPGC